MVGFFGSSSIPTPNYASVIAIDVVGALIGAFAGFSLYKCARSLVPLNRISSLEVAPKVEPLPP